MLRLDGHSALITGSTQGVGAAIARTFVQAGARVVLHGLTSDENLTEQLRSIAKQPSDVQVISGDLVQGQTEGIDHVFAQAVAADPEIDILVNNAGGYFDQPFLDMDFARFDKTMKLNVYAYFFLTQHFARRWVERSVAGRVLLVGSINGRLAEQDHVAYDSSKGAVEMMVKSLCVSLAPHGIRVNGMAPGLFYTPLTAAALDQPEFRSWMEQHTPNGEVPGPEVCGEAAAYLVSDEARHVHGHMLMVDGGMSVWQQPGK